MGKCSRHKTSTYKEKETLNHKTYLCCLKPSVAFSGCKPHVDSGCDFSFHQPLELTEY